MKAEMQHATLPEFVASVPGAGQLAASSCAGVGAFDGGSELDAIRFFQKLAQRAGAFRGP